MTWYCIRTERRAELSLVGELRELGFTAYVPCEIHNRKIRRTMERVTVPAFPGYAFVNCSAERLGEVGACEGAFDVVRYASNGEPARMPRNALLWLLLAEIFGDMDHTRVPAAYRPDRGDRVTIKAGKWRGYVGRIISVGKRKSLLEPDKGFGRWEVENAALELAAA